MKLSGLRYPIVKKALLVLFILFQGYLIFLKKHDALDIDVTPNTNPTLNICGEGVFGQTFIAPKNGVGRIDVMLGTHGRKNDRDVIFELREIQPDNRLITTTVINASSVKNNLYHPFAFKPVKNSERKVFYFFFFSPESTQENSICIWMNNRNIYKKGDFLFNHHPERSDLIFRVYSRRPVFSELRRVVRNYSGIFGNVTFLLLAIVFFEAAQILMFSKLLDWVRRVLQEKKPD
jgi:hypothetical protein